MACVRIWRDRRLEELVHEFPTTVRGLMVLGDWLEAHEVETLVMETTGVYWKPGWAVPEDRFSLTLVNACHVKQVPGRKTDVLDAQWLCQLLEAGLLKASFVPPKLIRTLRNITRYRKTRIQVLDQGRLVALPFEEHHEVPRPGSPGGVAHPFKVLERALALDPDGPCKRREIVVETAVAGSGDRDAFELVTRTVTGERFHVDAVLARPEHGRTPE
jgi:hypothetical protein